jgi:hypothetical protein
MTRTAKMNPEIKAKWLEWLRSDNYKQATGRLRTGENSFCCLGVLCHIHQREAAGRWVLDSDGYSYTDSHETEGGVLPTFVIDWAGLQDCAPEPILDYGSGLSASLSWLNDHGMTFNEIANLIEKQL